MQFLKEFILSISQYTKVLGFVLRNQIWSFFIFPLVFNTLLLGTYLWTVFSYSSDLMNVIEGWVGLENHDTIGFLLKMLINTIFVIMIFYTYQFISLLILPPLYSYISEKVQLVLTGIDSEFSFSQLMNDIKRGLIIAIKNVFYQMMIALVVILLSIFLPFLAPFAPFVLFFVGAYFQGFSMMDYRNEYHRLSVVESMKYIKEHKGIAIGNGTVFQLFLLVPIIGTIFAPVFSIVAAALTIYKVEEKSIDN